MNEFLTPDTSMALLQASEGQNNKIRDQLKYSSKERTDQLDKVAREFEAVFVAEMLKPMFEGTQLEEPFGGGKGEEIFQGFMLQEYGKIIAQTGRIGIADHVKQELINLQEQKDNDITFSE